MDGCVWSTGYSSRGQIAALVRCPSQTLSRPGRTALAGERSLCLSLNLFHGNGSMDSQRASGQSRSCRAAWLLCVLLWAGTTLAADRQPLTPRPLVFSRSQMKYGLDRHYLRHWVDRPLLIDPGLRVEKQTYAMAFPSYQRILGVVSSYGLDGLAFFPETSGRMGAFEYTDQAAVPGLKLLPEFITKADSLAAKRDVLKAALACRSCVRINDRLLISSYRADRLSPDKWRTMLAALRDEFGDVFLFIPDITQPCGESWAAWMERYDSEQGVSVADRERLRQYLRSYALATDGLYMAASAGIKKERRFHTDFYREFLAPFFRDVLSEPDLQGKCFGLSACGAHINCTRLGYTLSDDGTRTLRNSFEAALSVRPDVIIIPEWDEQNENTSLRPTVDNSFSSRRIVHHYMRRIRGLPAAPMPGDRLDLPNLVLSYRKLLTLGEELRIELLNIPDSDAGGTYTAGLALLDLDGHVAHRFEDHTFKVSELSEITESVPSETLARYSTLIPAVRITQAGKRHLVERGWRPIQLRATWNWDYKWVKQPLRDLAALETCDLHIDRVGDRGEVRLAGHVDGDEPLASVELIEDGAVVYAVDPRPDALRQLEDHTMLAVEYRALKRRGIKGHVRVVNGRCRWPQGYETPKYSWRLDGDVLRLHRYVGWSQTVAYLAVSSVDVAKAQLEFQIGDLTRTVPVADIIEREIISYHDGADLTVTVSHFRKQNAHPPHLGTPGARFSTIVRPDLPSSLFHVRVVTKSGKLFRSRPVRQEWLFGEKSTRVPIWSEAGSQAQAVTVEAPRVPRISYTFSDRHGAALVTDAGRPFWGILGGYTDSVTARGGGASNDGTPFIRPSHYPKDAESSAPAWRLEGGRPCLLFTGTGGHIALPQGVLPRRGAFHLKMEIKPLGNQNCVLFVHRRHYIGSLTLGLDQGKLRGSFTTDQLKTYIFTTDLQVPANAWAVVEAIYDLSSMRLRVNGVETGPFECEGVGLYDMSSVFGGFGGGGTIDEFTGNSGWFQGFLGGLSVSHSVE